MRFSDLKKIFSKAYATYAILSNGIEFHYLSTAVTANSTTTVAPAGSFGVTSHATGRGLLFYSDGTKWQASDATSVPVKATGTEINIGTDDAKFVTPKAIADSTISRGNTAAYDKTTAGAQTLIGGNPTVRQCLIRVEVTETFAAGDGAATIFDIGETGTAEKFKADLNTGTAGDVLTYGGVLSGDAALLVTATAATGTGTGAITVTALAIPDAA